MSEQPEMPPLEPAPADPIESPPAVPAAAPVLANVTIIVALLAGVGMGGDRAKFLSWGIFATGVVQFVWLWIDCRRIGVGFTGLGDALVMLGLRYDSAPGREMAARIAMSDAACRPSSAPIPTCAFSWPLTPPAKASTSRTPT